MYATVWTSLLSAVSAWGPGLSLCGLILFAAQRAWVSYLKHRGADYVRAQAEIRVINRLIEFGCLSLEIRKAELAQEERLAVADVARPAKKAA